jgi:exopolysaccharide production protein ExoQ
MPKELALAFCSLFVLVILRLERRQVPKTSHMLWIPTIWILLIASKPLSTWLGLPGDLEQGNSLDRVVLSSLFCFAFMILISRNFDWSGAIRRNRYLMFLIGYMLISLSWSPIPFTSLKRLIRELVAVVMAFIVLTESDPREAMTRVFRRTAFILIPFSLLLIKYYPQYGIMYDTWSGARIWIGVALHKNGLGRLCIFSAFFLIWSLVRRRRGHEPSGSRYLPIAEVTVLILSLVLLKGPGYYSATAIVSLAGGLATFIGLLWIQRSRHELRPNLFAAISALIIVLGIGTVMSGGSTVARATSTVGRDTTLTGRTGVWAMLVPVFERRPYLGSGFGSFWTSASREYFALPDAHSGYLDVLLELGYVGMVVFALFLLSSCRKAQSELHYDFDWGCLFLCFLIMALLHNITESSLNSFDSHLTAVVLFLAITLKTEPRTQEDNSCSEGLTV